MSADEEAGGTGAATGAMGPPHEEKRSEAMTGVIATVSLGSKWNFMVVLKKQQLGVGVNSLCAKKTAFLYLRYFGRCV